MIEIEKSELGEIHYKLPDVDDMLMLMHFMALDPQKLSDETYMRANQFKALAGIIKNLSFFVVKVDLKVNELIINNYEDAKKQMACMKMLISISERLLSALDLDSKKKQQ